MKTTVEELIKQRSFNSLTASEREEVRELCSNEEDFLRMKQFLLGVETMSQHMKTEASSSLKTSLNSVFATKHPGVSAVWNGARPSGSGAAPVIPLYQRNWVRAAAVALLIVGSAPFFLWQSDTMQQESPELAKLDDQEPNSTGKTKSEQLSADKTIGNQINSPESQSVSSELDAAVQDNDEVAYRVNPSEANMSRAESHNEPTASAESVTLDEGSAKLTTSANAGTYMWSAPATSELASSVPVTSQANRAMGGVDAKSAAKDSYGKKGAKSAKDNRGMNRGMLADLEPGKGDQARNSGTTVNTRSMAEQPEELLDLLVPAF